MVTDPAVLSMVSQESSLSVRPLQLMRRFQCGEILLDRPQRSHLMHRSMDEVRP